MKRYATGITFDSRARARARSRSGSSSRLGSAATAIQMLQHLRHRDASREEEDVEVIDEVRPLLGHALVRLRSCGLRGLGGLLAHLGADPGRILEKLDGVRALGTVARPGDQGPLQRGQRLVDRRGRLAPHGGRVDAGVGGALEVAVEARALARVAGRPRGLDQGDHRVPVAVVAQLAHPLHVARGDALVPDVAARAAVQVHLARPPGPLQSLLVHVRDHQHLARVPVLDHARDQPALVELDSLDHRLSVRGKAWPSRRRPCRRQPVETAREAQGRSNRDMIPAASGYFSLFLVASILAIVAPEWPSPDWLIFLPLAAASLGAGFFLCRWNAVWLVLLIPAAFATTDVLWVANVIEPPVGWY